MKSLNLNVPDDKAQVFAQEIMALMQKHGVTIENKEVLDSMRPITERVKTFEDAMEVLGENHPLVKMFQTLDHTFNEDEHNRHLFAYAKLTIIVAALNEGWQPTFSDDEYRYYPWFVFYTKDELDAMDEDERSGRLCFKNRALAEYAGQQFLAIYADFHIGF